MVNVDKRLTLKQAIPRIKYLQEKKANGAHKNESAKNYFTCHDTSRNNLGFMEFTDTNYNNEPIANLMLNSNFKGKHNIIIHYITEKDIRIISLFESSFMKDTNVSQLIDDINSSEYIKKNKNPIVLSFDENILFDDYVAFKSIVYKLNAINRIISNNEYISN